jgi:hypothetical protein
MYSAAIGKWATVIALSMTPALLLGQSAAAVAGIGWQLNPWILVPVMAVSGFIEGVLVAWLGGTTTRIGFVQRWCERMRKPRAVAFAKSWGAWGGMTLGVAVLGQEPILLALRFLGVDLRKLIAPIAVSNAIFAAIYYFLVRFGLDRLSVGL